MATELSPSASTSASALPSRSKKSSKSAAVSSSVPPLGKFLASSTSCAFLLHSPELLADPRALLTGEKHVRDKAVASLSRFLSAGRLAKQKQQDDESSEAAEDLPVGELNWDEEWEVDSRLAPAEMAKLWKGIFFCTSLPFTCDSSFRASLTQSPAHRFLDVRQAPCAASARAGSCQPYA